MWKIWLAMALTACVPSAETEGYATAEYVWELYGHSSPAPETVFVYPPDLNCGNDSRGPVGFKHAGVCKAGAYSVASHRITVAKPDFLRWSETALAHELWHAHISVTYGPETAERVGDGVGFDPENRITETQKKLFAIGQ